MNMQGFVETLVAASEVRALRRDIDELKASLPKTEKGHHKFTYEQAVGLQKMQFRYQEGTRLAKIEGGLITFHDRPGAYLKAPPVASMRTDLDDLTG